MAAISATEIKAYATAAVDFLETNRASAATLAGGTGKIDVAVQAIRGDFINRGSSPSIGSFRGNLNGTVSRDMAAALLTPVVFEYAKLIGSPGAGVDVARCLRDLYVYYVANTNTVKSRNITTVAGTFAGGNTGTGSLSRSAVDENNYAIESRFIELKTLKCVQDQNTGARKHAEVFNAYGIERGIDDLDVANHGSGASRTLTSHHAGSGDGGSLLVNSSFSDYLSTGSVTTKFPGWTVTTAAANVTTSATYFRGFPGSAENTTGGPSDLSIQFTADDTISQKLTVSGTTLDPSRPYFLRAMLYRQSSATGTVTLAFGSQTVTVALSSLTNSTWTELLMTVGQKNWPKYVDEQNLDISIGVASLATSTFLVDDVLFAPYDQFDGTWWFLRGGATAWLLDDSWTGTDTGGAAADAKIQYWFQWAFPGFYWPSTTGTVTWSDP